MDSDSPVTNREQALCLLALSLVSLLNDVPVMDACDNRFRKQFLDHLASHGVLKPRAQYLHKLVQTELQPQLF